MTSPRHSSCSRCSVLIPMLTVNRAVLCHWDKVLSSTIWRACTADYMNTLATLCRTLSSSSAARHKKLLDLAIVANAIHSLY